MRLFNAASVPRPNLDFQFDETLAVDLEIGAGQGLHAINYCVARPDRTLLAVEKTHTRFNSLARRLKNHPHLKNLVPLHADASAFVTHFIPDNSLSHVFLLYPNPYPKGKQANLRWHNRPFLATLLKKMKPGAGLTLATNLEWYAKEALFQLTGTWQLEVIEYSTRNDSPRTHFERKYQARQEICWNLELRKPPCIFPVAKVQ